MLRLRFAQHSMRGMRKVTDGLADVRIKFVEPAEWKVFDSEGLLFKNMNSPADYEEAKLRLEGRRSRRANINDERTLH